ncbi:Wzz/FepE/Etk N-terminal domain-containing protein [Halalkalibacter urbisdiaboli]|uniref:Wzz/FepE/Etk N-terminal domain-containing protein n=1 Tax=Halalkalibacter urbisdiaboli TaxID=1960589 RepID=UPI001055CCA9|nr:Wzz/FepE/Etk N-terminal domain-containing protein [Halalkalibacter urbisdiaboli]
MDEQYNLKGLLLLCKRRIMTILLSFTLIIVLTSIMTIYVLEPKYEYSKQVIVGQLAFKNENDSYTLSTANIQLIRSYMDVIISSIVLDAIIQELELNRPYMISS